MRRSLSTFLILIFLISILMSFKTKTTQIQGNWRIESVLIGADTLFLADNIQITSNFYTKHMMGGWDKSESDVNYITKCIRSTYVNLNQVRLNIKRRKYDQSAIIPCWDHIIQKGIIDGKYSFENDTLKLLDNTMELRFYNNTNILTYIDSKNNYQINYRKLSEK